LCECHDVSLWREDKWFVVLIVLFD
jgi:hypothetical protein